MAKYEFSPNTPRILSTTTDFRVVIQDIYVIARKVKVNPAVIYGHAQILEKQNALYPYTKMFKSKLSLLETVHLFGMTTCFKESDQKQSSSGLSRVKL